MFKILFGLLTIATLVVTITFISPVGGDNFKMEFQNKKSDERKKASSQMPSRPKTMSMIPIPVPIDSKELRANTSVNIPLIVKKRDKSKENSARR